MTVVHVQEAIARPHLFEDCWCKPTEQECPGCECVHVVHRMVEMLPDCQPRMAAFTSRGNLAPV